MKRSFTLIELIIAISLFLLLLLFLYKLITLAEQSNNHFEKSITQIFSDSRFKKILLEDIAESKKLTISKDKNNNSLIVLESTNMYHNKFFKFVTYLVSKEKNLIRIESLKEFNKNRLDDQFFKNSHIDIIQSKISSFEIVRLKQNRNRFSIFIKKEGAKVKIFSAIKFKN